MGLDNHWAHPKSRCHFFRDFWPPLVDKRDHFGDHPKNYIDFLDTPPPKGVIFLTYFLKKWSHFFFQPGKEKVVYIICGETFRAED